MYAVAEILGVGRSYSNLICKKAEVDVTKRADDLNSDNLEHVTIIQNPSDMVPEQTKRHHDHRRHDYPVEWRQL